MTLWVVHVILVLAGSVLLLTGLLNLWTAIIWSEHGYSARERVANFVFGVFACAGGAAALCFVWKLAH